MPEGSIGLHFICLYASLSVCHTSFPEFPSHSFHKSAGKLEASCHIKSYKSSSTFVTDDLLFHVLNVLPFVQNWFPDFSWLCFHISG